MITRKMKVKMMTKNYIEDDGADDNDDTDMIDDDPDGR